MNTQSICAMLGEYGCYFLSLLHLVKSDYGALTLYQLALDKKYIDADCYIRDPAALLQLAAGGKWNVRHESAEYLTTKNEQEILRFERKATGTTYAHFVTGDGFGNVVYDPLGDSRTVTEGQLISKRIIRRIE